MSQAPPHQPSKKRTPALRDCFRNGFDNAIQTCVDELDGEFDDERECLCDTVFADFCKEMENKGYARFVDGDWADDHYVRVDSFKEFSTILKPWVAAIKKANEEKAVVGAKLARAMIESRHLKRYADDDSSSEVPERVPVKREKTRVKKEVHK